MTNIITKNYQKLSLGAALFMSPFIALGDEGVPGGARGIRFELVNPLGEIDSVEALLLALLEAFIVIAVPIIVLYIIYSGFLYVSARGNSEQVKKATTSLTYAIIGGVLILGAVALADVLAGIVESFRVE